MKPRELTSNMFSIACLTSIEAVHDVFENGKRNEKLTEAGNKLRQVRMGCACLGREKMEGEEVLCGMVYPLPSRVNFTTGERERVKGTASRNLVGLARRESPDCEEDGR